MNKHRNKKTLLAFGKHLRSLRLEKGLSQEELNLESGLTKNAVGNIERGEINPTLSTIRALAKALNTHPKDLLDY